MCLEASACPVMNKAGLRASECIWAPESLAEGPAGPGSSTGALVCRAGSWASGRQGWILRLL